jgi:alpha-galactosidase
MRIVAWTLSTCVLGLDNGLAKTPPMGLSTWSVFRSAVNDSLVRELADSLVSTGLAKAGYDYLLVDDGWAGKGCTGCQPNRNASGHLVVDAGKFPVGLAATAAYVHSKGLKFGLWFGHAMCSGASNDTAAASSSHPDYATLDAELFAAAGVDAIKHDNCVDVANTTAAIEANYERFARLGAAMNKTGRPIMYDVVLQVRRHALAACSVTRSVAR